MALAKAVWRLGFGNAGPRGKGMDSQAPIGPACLMPLMEKSRAFEQRYGR